MEHPAHGGTPPRPPSGQAVLWGLPCATNFSPAVARSEQCRSHCETASLELLALQETISALLASL